MAAEQLSCYKHRHTHTHTSVQWPHVSIELESSWELKLLETSSVYTHNPTETLFIVKVSFLDLQTVMTSSLLWTIATIALPLHLGEECKPVGSMLGCMWTASKKNKKLSPCGTVVQPRACEGLAPKLIKTVQWAICLSSTLLYVLEV